MGVGKYSPTVSSSYSQDQDWFEKNGGGFGNGMMPESQFDNQGYDSYGYSGYTKRDRAGYTENDYLNDSFNDDHLGLYDRVRDLWNHYNVPTILDMATIVLSKVENDKLFAFNHAKMVTVINIYEAATTAKYQLDQTFKMGAGAEGHDMYQKEFKAFFAEVAKNIAEHSVFLEEFYDKFLTDFVKLQKSFK